MSASSNSYKRDNVVLSSFFALYFAILGGVVPYFSLHLESLGYSPKAIGALMSILMITKMLAPNIWGYWIDKQYIENVRLRLGLNKHFHPIMIGSLMAGIFFVCLMKFTQFWWIGVFLFAYSFFWNAVLPQFEAIVYDHLGEKKFHYGRIRLWGSIGFIISVFLIGWGMEEFGIEILLPCIAMLFVLTIVTVTQIKTAHVSANSSSDPIAFKHCLTPSFLWVLVLASIAQMCHAPFYAFFSIYLEGYGYSKSIIGGLWALGVIAEVFVFLLAHHLFVKFSLKKLLIICFLGSTIRWFLFANYPEQISLMIFGQILHAVTFGLFHATMSQMIQQHFVVGTRVRGQALYSSCTYGVGGAIGTLGSGFIWESIGGEATFLICFGVMLVTSILALGMRNIQKLS